MKKIDKKKLQFRREYIRVMGKEQLVAVIGGVGVATNNGNLCSGGCNTGSDNCNHGGTKQQ